jgi:uncharacterized membrane protein (DUF106 family)
MKNGGNIMKSRLFTSALAASLAFTLVSPVHTASWLESTQYGLKNVFVPILKLSPTLTALTAASLVAGTWAHYYTGTPAYAEQLKKNQEKVDEINSGIKKKDKEGKDIEKLGINGERNLREDIEKLQNYKNNFIYALTDKCPKDKSLKRKAIIEGFCTSLTKENQETLKKYIEAAKESGNLIQLQETTKKHIEKMRKETSIAADQSQLKNLQAACEKLSITFNYVENYDENRASIVYLLEAELTQFMTTGNTEQFVEAIDRKIENMESKLEAEIERSKKISFFSWLFDQYPYDPYPDMITAGQISAALLTGTLAFSLVIGHHVCN